MLKNTLVYLLVMLVLGVGIYIILDAGSHLAPSGQNGSLVQQASAAPPAAGGQPASGLLANLSQPLSTLLLQIILIILAARGLGMLFTRIGQPAVVGEMLAGIMLGPSLLGWLLPQVTALVFPAGSLSMLQLLSQVGVILFMFMVGMELDLDHLRSQAYSVMFISHTSIMLPFLLGTGLALIIYPSMGPAGISFPAFALFMGIAMSITAFPVLARIIEQRRLAGSSLGNLAIACAAVDDVTAWCVLAVVLCIARSSDLGQAALTIGLALLFALAMLLLVRPGLARMAVRFNRAGIDKKGLIAGALVFAFASALFTESIGIYALFGAFLAGVVLPRPKALGVPIAEHLEAFTAFLLPLFFAFTGLRTQIGLLNDWGSWLLCFCVIAVAIAGKLGGASLAARSTGLSWQESLNVGALMNTRGLMELIAINIGYDLGILSTRMFAIMVIMALTTTVMTGPILSALQYSQRRRRPETVEREISVQ